MADWRLLSTHGSVLLCIARTPDSRLRDIAECVGITERAVHSIVCDLVDEGYVVKTRKGNRNSYELRPNAPVEEPMLEERAVGSFVSALAAD
jgi:DNA-binding transcriptional regulator PaaX